MTVTLTVDPNNRLIVPQETIDALHLEPGKSVEVQIQTVTDAPPHKSDPEKFAAALDKFRGSLREQFLADGYNSVDEYMDDIRPKW
jgi:bifunctional DNA-binding transcriptional regulator/antitoxin component of YhaV-PrlF toxin-antitoxin module